MKRGERALLWDPSPSPAQSAEEQNLPQEGIGSNPDTKAGGKLEVLLRGPTNSKRPEYEHQGSQPSIKITGGADGLSVQKERRKGLSRWLQAVSWSSERHRIRTSHDYLGHRLVRVLAAALLVGP